MASGKEIPWAKAHQTAKEALELLAPMIERGEVVGSIARKHDTVHDIDLLVIPKPGSELESDPGQTAENVSEAFDTHIDIFLTTPESWEASLVHWVIGRAIIPLKSHARKMGLHLNRYGLFDASDRPITRSIQGIYGTLELPIPPSLQPFLKGGSKSG